MNTKEIHGVQLNRKMNVMVGGAYAMPRITHRAAHGTRLPCFKIKCGDCDKSFELYYDLNDPAVECLEIAGVYAGIEDWRAILLPLLGFERQGDTWVDKKKS